MNMSAAPGKNFPTPASAPGKKCPASSAAPCPGFYFHQKTPVKTPFSNKPPRTLIMAGILLSQKRGQQLK
jgi:hypothetical protein